MSGIRRCVVEVVQNFVVVAVVLANMLQLQNTRTKCEKKTKSRKKNIKLKF